MKLTGAQITVETLIEQGTEVVFGYPGGQVIDLYDALYQAGDRIHHVLTAHEQGASHAADGYARSSGKVGVVIATSGPGATNLVTGIATAHLDSTPMVAITGNVSNAMIGRDSFQEVDITGITIPITKHNFFVKHVEDLADTIRTAFQIAKSGRPGPVLIDIPKDVQTGLCEYEPAPVVEKEKQRLPKEFKIEWAAKMIRESQRPYIYIGGGAITADASKEIEELADRIDAPIGSTLMGLSAISHENPRFLGMEGMHGHYASSMAQNEADLIGGANFQEVDRRLQSVLVDMATSWKIDYSLQWGHTVLQYLAKINTLHRKQVEQAGFLVLKAPGIPSILVETAFISNPQEERKLKTAAYQQKVAEAILRGIKTQVKKNDSIMQG